MNGDLRTIYNAIKEIDKRLDIIETRQSERHRVNTEKLKVLDKLPCEKHAERMLWLDKSVKVLWGVLIVGGLITAALKYWSGQ